MSGTFDDKAVLITGASSGNGRAIAERFGEEGASVTIMDIQRSPQKGGTPTDELLKERGNDAQFVKGDVTDINDIRNAVDATVEEFGGLNIAVNNAGVYGSNQPIEEVSEEEYYWEMDINIKGVYFGSQATIEAMRAQGEGGAIVNLASVSGIRGLPSESVYCASKGAVINLTRSLAYEVGPDGIRVNSVSPGPIDTELSSDFDLDTVADQEIPIGRPGRPDDVANAVQFLAKEESSFINGHNLVVDGGMTIREAGY